MTLGLIAASSATDAAVQKKGSESGMIAMIS